MRSRSCTATHPCLLSSSGSGPGELERGAQLLSAGGGHFTLQDRNTFSAHTHINEKCVFDECKNRTQVVLSALSTRLAYNRYLTRDRTHVNCVSFLTVRLVAESCEFPQVLVVSERRRRNCGVFDVASKSSPTLHYLQHPSA